MRRQEGFTLLELMIVLALIVIMAAIAIPSMKEAKINADEASAVASIRAINTAEVSYETTYGDTPIRWRISEGQSHAASRRRRLVCWIRVWREERSRDIDLRRWEGIRRLERIRVMWWARHRKFTIAPASGGFVRRRRM